MKNKLVSVCITTFNRKASLIETVNSILSQTYQNIEVIIVDDCSSDGTDIIIKKILSKKKKIKYIRHKKNKGLAAARNTAIFNAKGRYF